MQIQLRDRILFAYYDKNTFILLSIFMKTTRKTPQMEIDKAKRFLKDWSDRNEK
ncbi:MAG: type II toxin-antitoxin system RelE/ParE family toxin [Clostridia bacterium]|nr:type II toxin-antitoxin system RelE/ParE family toxin [Clostridia bacterium]